MDHNHVFIPLFHKPKQVDVRADVPFFIFSNNYQFFVLSFRLHVYYPKLWNEAIFSIWYEKDSIVKKRKGFHKDQSFEIAETIFCSHE